MNIFYVKPKMQPSKGSLNTTEKCPYCLRGFMDFMDIGRTLGLQNGVFLGCYSCGGVFIAKEVCDSEKDGKKAMLEEQMIRDGNRGGKLAPLLMTPMKYGFWKGVDTQHPIEETNEQPTDPIFDIPVSTVLVNGCITKCGVAKTTDKKRKQHEKMCKKCKEIDANPGS